METLRSCSWSNSLVTDASPWLLNLCSPDFSPTWVNAFPYCKLALNSCAFLPHAAWQRGADMGIGFLVVDVIVVTPMVSSEVVPALRVVAGIILVCTQLFLSVLFPQLALLSVLILAHCLHPCSQVQVGLWHRCLCHHCTVVISVYQRKHPSHIIVFIIVYVDGLGSYHWQMCHHLHLVFIPSVPAQSFCSWPGSLLGGSYG